MKRCPECGETFPDETNFCLMDGTPLGAFQEPEEATVTRSAPIMPPSASQALHPSASRMILGYVFRAIPFVIIAVLFGLGAWFIIERSLLQSNSTNVNRQTRDQGTPNPQNANLQKTPSGNRA